MNKAKLSLIVWGARNKKRQPGTHCLHMHVIFPWMHEQCVQGSLSSSLSCKTKESLVLRLEQSLNNGLFSALALTNKSTHITCCTLSIVDLAGEGEGEDTIYKSNKNQPILQWSDSEWIRCMKWYWEISFWWNKLNCDYYTKIMSPSTSCNEDYTHCTHFYWGTAFEMLASILLQC